MRELGRVASERLEDQQVLEGVGQVILAADDVADAQIGVVDARGEVIGGHAVTAQQGEVFDLVGEFGLLAVDAIVEVQGAVRGRAGRDSASAKGSPAAARRSLSSRDISRMPGLQSQAPCAEEDWLSSPAWAGVKSR